MKKQAVALAVSALMVMNAVPVFAAEDPIVNEEPAAVAEQEQQAYLDEAAVVPEESVSQEDAVAGAEVVDTVEAVDDTAIEVGPAVTQAEAGLARELEEAPVIETVNDNAVYDHLTVAGTTPLTGRFFSDQWGNGAADLDVRSLIHGYNLIRWNANEGMFEIDPSVVSGNAVAQNKSGDVRFHISLYQDLQFSDGTPITAENYVFSLLLRLAPAMKEIGADIGKLDYIYGSEAYAKGETNLLSGVHLISDYEFSIIIDHSYLPYFYELGLLDIVPYPIHVITPGYQVKDEGKGVYFADKATGEAAEPDAALLKQTLLDETTGYVSHPQVTSGPYILESYDGETAEFTINPLYKGNFEGIKPSIESLTFGTVTNEEIASKLENREIDLVNRVSDQETIRKAMALVNGGTAGTSPDAAKSLAMISYPRSGLSFISFCAGHHKALEEKEIRQAFAWCLDREGLTQAYEERFGTAVNGWYGIGQWMYSLEKDFAEQLPSYEAQEEEAVRKAIELLTAAGWTENAAGDPYREGEDTLRWKKMPDGTRLALEFTLACPDNSRIRGILEEHLAARLGKAGILLHIVPVDGAELLKMYSSGENEEYDLLYLATNFSVVFDPCDMFKESSENVYEWTGTGIHDNGLYEAAVAMQRCKPGDVEKYRSCWKDFQKRFCELLPVLPVYSNVYFDFYSGRLQGYNPVVTTSWAQAAAQAYLSDVPVTDAP